MLTMMFNRGREKKRSTLIPPYPGLCMLRLEYQGDKYTSRDTSSDWWCNNKLIITSSWWRHGMDALSVVLALFVSGIHRSPTESHDKRLLLRSFDAFDLMLAWNNLLNKPSIGRWFEAPWRSCDVILITVVWQCRIHVNYINIMLRVNLMRTLHYQ